MIPRRALGALVLAVAAVPCVAHGAPRTLDFVEAYRDFIGGLAGPLSVAVSPDGVHVYVAATAADSVTAFRHDAGGLTYLETRTDGVAGVDGLDGAFAVAMSPDGANVYVAAPLADAVTVFARDAVTGALAFLETHVDGVAGVDGLGDAVAVTVSPDGGHVYATGIADTDDAVAIFTRDAGTGRLTYAGAVFGGFAGLADLDAPADVTVSPDGAHVYVASSVAHAVVAFARNALTGALTHAGTVRDGVGGVAGLGGARAVAVTADGTHVYATGTRDGTVAAFARDAGTGALTFVNALQDGVGGVDGLAGARVVAPTADGAHVYVAGPSDHAVAILARDAGTGALAWLGRIQGGFGSALRGARAVAVAPGGAHLYTAAYEESAVGVFARDAGTGLLTFVERRVHGESLFGLGGANDLALAPDAAHVYVAASASDAIAAFARDDASGALTFVEALRDGVGGVDGLNGASAVAISPEGAHVYAAGPDDDAVVAFARDGLTGRLTPLGSLVDGVGGVDGLDGVTDVVLAPDGAQAYVASPVDRAVVVLARDAGTGVLSPVQVLFDGVGGVTSIGGVRRVVPSPDGRHVYALSTSIDHAVTVFARDLVTGTLTPAGVLGQSFSAMTLSPDGLFAYAPYGTTLARDPVGGGLTVLSADYYTGGFGDAVVGTDHVYSSSYGVRVFDRDPTTGTTRHIHDVTVDDVLTYTTSVATDPTGRHVYVANGSPGAVALLVPGFSGCDATAMTGCRLPAQSGVAKLLLSDGAGPNDRLVWKWAAKGEPTVAADFGAPATTTHYALCAYDGTGVALRALVPARSGWIAIPDGFKYRNKLLTPEGVSDLSLKAKDAGRGAIKMRAKGALLDLPALPPALPLRVQLQQADGTCWEAVFSAAGVLRNEPDRLLAVSD